ncbi:hypothetical protein [Streptomyces cylindrosporus]|uniref:Uncharacterized protein n=1 Tax=Streptomyces cylindrosporus TaxID=2927583 RepID=A0ABS9YGB2_9ACTN|nr:hypothetical protein [Streptomyces cylindrosporus]MCI3276277.1 hypothetical protein [Streptomyces cylindrosporus]
MAEGSLRSRQLKAERWKQRQEAATTNRQRAIVLVDMARAYVGDDDPLWAALVRLLHERLSSVLG